MSTTGDANTGMATPPGGGPPRRSWSAPMIFAVVGLGLVIVTGLVVVGLLARDGSGGREASEDGGTEEAAGSGETQEANEAGEGDARRDDGDVAIFLCDGRSCPEITDEQRSELEAELEEHAMITEFEYESKEQAYQRFLTMFEDRPDLIESTDPDALPAAFRVWVEDGQRADQLVEAFEGHPGVDVVTVNVGLPAPGEDRPDAAWGDDDLAEAISSAPVLTIFLCTGQVCEQPTDADRSQLEDDLEANPQVTRFEYESQEEAYERLLELFEDRDTLTEAIDPSDAPASYRVWVDDPMPYFEDPLLVRELAEGFGALPGVEEVVDALEPIRRHTGG